MGLLQRLFGKSAVGSVQLNTIKHKSARQRLKQRGNLDHQNLEKADFAGVNLSGIKMCFVNFEEADLSKSNLSGANLYGAVLTDANLSGADLRRTNLNGAKLDSADLRNAKLQGANLCYADFRGAEVDGADFTGALWSGGTVIPVGFDLIKAGMEKASPTEAEKNIKWTAE